MKIGLGALGKPAPGSGARAYGKQDLEDVFMAPADQRVGQKTPGLKTPGRTASEEFRLAGRGQKRVLAHLPELRPGDAFDKRLNPGQVKVLLNEHVEVAARDGAAEVPGDARCVVERAGGGVPVDARYMRDTLEARATFVNQRIMALKAALEDHGVDCSHPVNGIANEPTVVVGRVCCDGEGRLNEASVLLEGSVECSRGMRVRVDTSGLPHVNLFPGQVVAIEGLNPSGHCLVALSVLGGLPRPLARSAPAALGRAAARTGAAGLDLVVASGPFTTTEDLSFRPLQELLRQLRAEPPDVLVLAGPFVDREHPQVRNGLIDATFAELFEGKPKALVEEYCAAAGPHARVVLLPAVRDVHHDPVFPQPRFRDGAFGPQVTCVGNPGVFRCNELVVGAMAHDVVKHLAGAGLSRGGSDRMQALAGHPVRQNCFYPLFPPALGACLDTTLAQAHEGAFFFREATPDLLILPSDLNPFAKLVPVAAAAAAKEGHRGRFQELLERLPAPAGRALCVNPGRLARGPTGGTFARLRVAPSEAGLDAAAGRPTATNGPQEHGLERRARVELVRV